jgi:two-component system response regulator
MTNVAEILLVEDNPGDVELVRAAFESGEFVVRLTVARDGNEALKILLHEDGYRSFPRPDLVLVDLSMPNKGGIELLREIRAHASIKALPVVILSASQLESDVVASYKHAANSFVAKPSRLSEWGDVTAALRHYWFSVVERPSAALG